MNTFLQRTHHSLAKNYRAYLSSLLVILFVYSPIVTAYALTLPTQALAAEVAAADESKLAPCKEPVSNVQISDEELAEEIEIDPDIKIEEDAPNPDSDEVRPELPAVEDDAGVGEEPGSHEVTVDENSDYLQRLPNKDLIKTLLDTYGIYDSAEQGWRICSHYADNFLSLVPVVPEAQQYFDALEVLRPRIGFKNKFDAYALTGDICSKPVGTGCDETVGQVPVLDDEGKQMMVAKRDEQGNEIKNPDGTVQMEGLTEQKPLYYQDLIKNTLGGPQWDAPKVDLHVLKTLVYLVTPAELGGAGREYVRVSRITQFGKNTKELGNLFAADDPEATPDPEGDDQPILRQECGPGVYSVHYFDGANPGRPRCLAMAMDIDQIDNMRITTKITKKKHAGGDKVEYRYKEFPIKIAWQTDKGVSDAKNGPPPVDIYSGAQMNFNTSILDLLDEFGMEMDIDAETSDINSIGDLAQALGQSLLGQLINGPGSSLSGWDLPSTLEKFGRAYIAKELGLVPGALSENDGDVVENIGRNTIEYNFGFSRGSLKGSNTNDIYSNVGRRYIEDKVLRVSSGSLQPSANGPISSKAQFLQRVGEGKVERAFGLLPQSLRGKSSFQDVKNANLKTQFIFDANNSGEVDERLRLTYVESDANEHKDLYGYTASQFETPTARFINGQLSAADYFQLIGSRTISSTIGQFTSHIDNSVCLQSTGKTGRSIFDGLVGCNPGTVSNACANVISEFADNNPFDACNINDLHTALTQRDPVTNQTMVEVLKSAGAFSSSNSPPLDEVVARLLKIQQDGSYYIGGDPGGDFSQLNARIGGIERAIDDPNPRVGWALIFQNALEEMQAKLETEQSNNEDSTDDAVRRSERFLNQSVTLITSFRQAINAFVRQEGQSAASAALNLSGNELRYNEDGQLTNIVAGPDPITTLLGGDLSIFPTIGRQITARLITNDTIAQSNIASKLLEDLTLTFKTLDKIGVSTSELREKGLQEGDLQRIFQKGLSVEVFERVGQTELLRTAWGKSGIASSINQNLSGDNASGIIDTAGQLVGAYNFYSERLDRLNNLARETATLAAQLPELQSKSQSAQHLRNLSGEEKPNSASGIRSKIQNYEAAFKDFREVSENTTQGRTIKRNATEAVHIIREIIAGNPLDFNQNPDASTGDNSSGPSLGCWSPRGLRDVVQLSKDARQSGFANLARNSASCRLDQAINLPNGSLKNWADSKDYSYDSLCTAIGRAQDPEKRLTDQEAHDNGEKVLLARAALLMSSLIPGFSKNESRFNLTGEDIAQMLNGNVEKVLAKIGGIQLDAGMRWKAGTAAKLISPTCKTTDTPPKDVACTAEEAKNIRLRTMAQLGLDELGLNLNFPSSFDILGGGSFAGNYGRARISQDLGLLENSFQGSVADVLRANPPQIFMNAFGVQDTPFTIRALTLVEQLNALMSTEEDTSTLQVIIGELQNYISQSRQRQIAEVRNENSKYWLMPIAPQEADQLAAAESEDFRQALENISLNYSGSGAALVKEVYVEFNSESPGYWGDRYGVVYMENLDSFIQRIVGLDGKFNVDAGSFKRFLTGKLNADEINKKTAKEELQTKLLNELYTKIPEGPLKTFVDGLATFTGSNCSPANMILELASSKTCGIPAIADIPLNRIFSGDKAFEQQRLFIFDHFLSRSFGAKLEDIANLRPGVIRNMVADPNRAPEIALGEGLNMIAGKLFSTQAEDSPTIVNLKSNLRQAFLAGFYDTSCSTAVTPNSSPATCNSYTYNFNSPRAKTSLMAALNTTLDSEIGTMSTRRFGVAITRADLQGIVSGNAAGTLTFLGAQQFAFQLNKTLDATNDSRASNFKLSYLDIRNAFSPLTTLTPQEMQSVREKTTAAFRADPQYNFCHMRPSSFCTDVLNDRVKEAEVKYKEERTKTARERLQYGLYDVAAFKFDPNIPAGFAYAMFKGNSADRLKMIGMYGFNALNLQSTFGGFLNAQQFGTLIDLARTNFKDTAKATEAIQNGALAGLERWVGQQFKNIFGIELPSDTVIGFAAWASTGFDKNKFTSDKISFGGRDVPAIGHVMRTFAVSKLLSWGDKTLGFEAGSLYSVYQSYKAYQAAQAAYDAALWDEMFAWEFGDIDEALEASDGVDKAKLKVKEAQAAMISLAINLVAGKQIARLEGSLGLVPGTGAIAVGMVVNLLMGVPISPISIALFIGINLFSVYKITVDIRGSQDGFYPYTPGHDYYYPLSPGDMTLGEFDAKNSTAYKEGVKLAAQNKVHGLLQNLLVMPDNWSLASHDNPEDLWISQGFTLSDATNENPLHRLDRLISRPAPWDPERGNGYGEILKRIQPSTLNNGVAKPKSGYYAGYFPDEKFAEHIHLRW